MGYVLNEDSPIRRGDATAHTESVQIRVHTDKSANISHASLRIDNTD